MQGGANRWVVKKRAIQLLLPFIAWALISPFLDDRPFSFLPLVYPDKGLWFLYNLFFYSVIANVSEWLESERKIKIEYSLVVFYCVLVLAMSFFHTLYNCTQLVYHIPFYYAGFLWKRHHLNLNMGSLTAVMGGYFLLLLIHLVPMWKDMLIVSKPVGYVYTYILEFFGMICFFELGKHFLDKDIPFLSNIGVKTLGIYACHFVIIHHIIRWLTEYVFELRLLISFAFTVLVSYIFVTVVSKIPYLRIFLIGKI